MGMREDRQRAAASTISHSEQMFEETGNPYYVAVALSAATRGEFLPPPWALESLLKAVDAAVSLHQKTGQRLSIDSALGLSVKRGQAKRDSDARKWNVEASAFDLVKTIHACFDVSIPNACELAYHAIDLEFARGAEENLWRPSKVSAENLASAGISEQQWADIELREKAQSEQIIKSLGEKDAVLKKLQGFSWWTITRGDRIGYSLERFIDQYYRVGSKRQPRNNGKLSPETFLLFQGNFLLLIPEACTKKIMLAGGSGYQLRSVSALDGLRKRQPFAEFCKVLESTGHKSGFSDQ